MRTSLTLRTPGRHETPVEVEWAPDGAFTLSSEGRTCAGTMVRLPSGESLLRLGERRVPFFTARVGTELHLWLEGEVYTFQLQEPLARTSAGGSVAAPAGEVRAPMPGRVVQVNAAPGREVAAGDLLVVIESMKVRFNVTAPAAGTVAEVLCEIGAMVELDALLARLEPHSPEGTPS